MPWTAVLRPAVTVPRGRCVFFPQAGSGPNSMLPLLSALPEEVEAVGVVLPGREHRLDEPSIRDFQKVVDEITAELAGLEPVVPTVYVGHSLGATLALACASARRELCDGLVALAGLPGGRHRLPVWLSGPGGPERLLALNPLYGELMTEEPELMHYARELLAADLRLTAAGLTATTRDAMLDVPLIALAGADDPVVPLAALGGWHRHTRGTASTRVVAGGHSFPETAGGASAVLHSIATLLGAVTPRAALAGAVR